jgi:VIT1/CCC1 family predicted Fe2+/Mn2+ transporter
MITLIGSVLGAVLGVLLFTCGLDYKSGKFWAIMAVVIALMFTTAIKVTS